MPELLRAEKLQKIGSSNKSVIMVYMAGAPPHQDLIDPKPHAPKEVRSAFSPIRTNVTGIHVNESLPMLAKVMDKWTGIRTMVGAPSGSHDSFMCYTGRPGSAFFDRPYPKPPGNWPSMGSSLSKLVGSRTRGLPPFVGLAPKAGHPPYGSPGEPGFLGAAHGPFRPTGSSSSDPTGRGRPIFSRPSISWVRSEAFGSRRSHLSFITISRARWCAARSSCAGCAGGSLWSSRGTPAGRRSMGTSSPGSARTLATCLWSCLRPMTSR